MDTRKTFTNRQLVAHYTNVSNLSDDAKNIVRFLLSELNLANADVDAEALSKLSTRVYTLLAKYDTK